MSSVFQKDRLHIQIFSKLFSFFRRDIGVVIRTYDIEIPAIILYFSPIESFDRKSFVKIIKIRTINQTRETGDKKEALTG